MHLQLIAIYDWTSDIAAQIRILEIALTMKSNISCIVPARSAGGLGISYLGISDRLYSQSYSAWMESCFSKFYNSNKDNYRLSFPRKSHHFPEWQPHSKARSIFNLWCVLYIRFTAAAGNWYFNGSFSISEGNGNKHCKQSIALQWHLHNSYGGLCSQSIFSFFVRHWLWPACACPAKPRGYARTSIQSVCLGIMIPDGRKWRKL